MSEPALKCKNNAIFKQKYTLKLLIAFKIAYSCRFGLRINLDFPDFLQKKFYNINYLLVNNLNITDTFSCSEFNSNSSILYSVWPDARIKSSPIFTKVVQKEPKQVFTDGKWFLKLHNKLPNIWHNFVTEYVSKTFQN